jgi:hypothetical protein
MGEPVWIGTSVALDPGCDIRKRLDRNDATFWFETPTGRFDLYLTDSRMAETLRDLFAEAVVHLRNVEARERAEEEARNRDVP